MADAPCGWFLRLDRFLKEKKWCPLSLDAATWTLRRDEKLFGMMVGHVDDLLFSGDDESWESFLAISRELGFDSREETDVASWGKSIRRDELKRICVSMEQHREKIQRVYR